MSSKESSKSVRFAANVASSLKSRDDKDTNNNEQQQQHRGRPKKRPRLERPNEDEADDVDDWQDDEEEAGDEAVPKASDLLNAKRKRRERKHGEDIDDDDDQEETHVDSNTSLFAEKDAKEDEIAVEPFNMNAEQNDGSGYFDGDTYVFRKREAEEEPDAWLESLSESKQNLASLPEKMDVEDESGGTGMDDLSKEDLYSKLVPLVGESENVLQAVARYGALLKRQGKSKGTIDRSNDSSLQAAQKALNDLTEAANALMLKGQVDIYQLAKSDLVQLLPDSKPQATKEDAEKPVVSWEYSGNQDGQIHGPYTTEQMLSWTQAGYFVGTQAVQIRTIRTETITKDKSIGEDLMSDLMDDDEEEAKPTEQLVKGEWRSSNDVDFTSYG